MALFTKNSNNPIATIERELAQLGERKAVIEERLAEVRTALQAAHDARRATLLDADLSDAEAIAGRDRACRDAEDKLTGLEDALAAIKDKVADAETRLAAERDRIAREADAREIDAAIDAVKARADELGTAGAALIKALEDLAPRIPGINPNFVPHMRSLLADLPTAARLLAADGAAHATQVRAGGATIHRPPPPPEPPAPAPEVERRRLYVFQNSKWTEPDGSIKTARQYSEAHVPAAIAERAITSNLACDFLSDRAARLRECYGLLTGPALAQDCVDLEYAGPPSGVIAEAVAEGVPGAKVTIGAAREIIVPVERRV
jgi:hypothetical protein